MRPNWRARARWTAPVSTSSMTETDTHIPSNSPPIAILPTCSGPTVSNSSFLASGETLRLIQDAKKSGYGSGQQAAPQRGTSARAHSGALPGAFGGESGGGARSSGGGPVASSSKAGLAAQSLGGKAVEPHVPFSQTIELEPAPHSAFSVSSSLASSPESADTAALVKKPSSKSFLNFFKK